MYKVNISINDVNGRRYVHTHKLCVDTLDCSKQKKAEDIMCALMEHKFVTIDTPTGSKAIMTDHIVFMTIDILEEDTNAD